MSKFSLYGLTYKEVLIVKHALRDKILLEEEALNDTRMLGGLSVEDIEKRKKYLREEKRCYEKVVARLEDINDYIKC